MDVPDRLNAGLFGGHQLVREIFHADDSWDQHEVHNGSDKEQAAREQPDQTRDPSAEVEPMQSENSEPAKQPEKI